MATEQAGSPPRRRVLVGALIGLIVGLFVTVPWGTFLGPYAPRWVQMAPLTLCFICIGAWFAAVTALSRGEQEETVETPPRAQPTLDTEAKRREHPAHATPA